MKKHREEFSKWLLFQESVLVWITTVSLILLAFLSIIYGYVGTIPWLATLCGFVWGAYGVSQAAYYNKSKKENTAGGIKFETTMRQMEKQLDSNDYEI